MACGVYCENESVASRETVKLPVVLKWGEVWKGYSAITEHSPMYRNKLLSLPMNHLQALDFQVIPSKSLQISLDSSKYRKSICRSQNHRSSLPSPKRPASKRIPPKPCSTPWLNWLTNMPKMNSPCLALGS